MKSTKSILGVILMLINLQSYAQFQLEINKDLKVYTNQLVVSFDEITKERKDQLTEIGDFLVSKLQNEGTFSVLFVCTHNSRRSHLADTWFKYASLFYGVDSLQSFTGGLEETAFNIGAINALERAGYTIHYNKEVENRVVSISPGKFPVWKMKSKHFSHPINPASNFIAVMVCSDADNSCPLVPGASARFALPYDDPRYYDGTYAEETKYDQTSRTIAVEMFYLADYIKSEQIINYEVTKR
ncbi:MAG: protein-tyrosine-phosphatase [Rickettsiales bacterium]|nr:protein-tyrosine-phosphatase [Rickettsiales bacterium]